MIEYRVTVDEFGTTRWHNADNQLHREDGPAIEYADGYKAWYRNGRRHREDGPAVEWPSGNKAWFLNGELHREDGPAYECSDGDHEWFIRGEALTEQEFLARTAKKPEEIVVDGAVYRRTN